MIDGLTLAVSLDIRAGVVVLRRAVRDDRRAIIRLLSHDPISADRGDIARVEDEEAYSAARERIIADPSNDLVVAVTPTGVVVGTLQVTVIPGMARRGITRLLVEAVRVASAERSSGIGSALKRWVVDEAAVAVGAAMVQLTSDAAREDAHRFYRRLCFSDSHVGFTHPVRQSASRSVGGSSASARVPSCQSAHSACRRSWKATSRRSQPSGSVSSRRMACAVPTSSSRRSGSTPASTTSSAPPHRNRALRARHSSSRSTVPKR